MVFVILLVSMTLIRRVVLQSSVSICHKLTLHKKSAGALMPSYTTHVISTTCIWNRSVKMQQYHDNQLIVPEFESMDE